MNKQTLINRINSLFDTPVITDATRVTLKECKKWHHELLLHYCKEIERNEAIELLESTKGAFFTVEFIKRTTGETRKLNGRLGVKKGITGKGLAYIPAQKELMTVWDVVKGAYRMINLDTLLTITFQNQMYKVI